MGNIYPIKIIICHTYSYVLLKQKWFIRNGAKNGKSAKFRDPDPITKIKELEDLLHKE